MTEVCFVYTVVGLISLNTHNMVCISSIVEPWKRLNAQLTVYRSVPNSEQQFRLVNPHHARGECL